MGTFTRHFVAKKFFLIFLASLCLGVIPVSCLAQSSNPKDAGQSIFDFHSGFWVNLHHFLYLEAVSEHPQKGRYPAVVDKKDTETLDSLSPEERTTWAAAVAYYGSAVIQRDLLDDPGMGAIKNQLEDAETSRDLAHVDIPAPLKAVLLKAAPIYRKYWWARHDAQNRKWIGQVQPLVGKHGEGLKNSLVKIYETPWPAYPVRVDVAVYAGEFGAYTTDGPTRPTLSSTDPTYQGDAALEMVFHETSHGMIDKVMGAIHAEETSLNKQDQYRTFRTKALWHAVLFYTAGELVAEQIPGYIPYASKNGLWARAWRDPIYSLMKQDWKPHMMGAAELQAASTKLVDDLAAAQRQDNKN